MVACILIVGGCTGQGSGNAVSGVLRSDDGGRTFEPYNRIDDTHTLERADIHALAISPHDNGTIYAGTSNDGLFKSVDGAQTWLLLNTGLVNIGDVAFSVQDADTVYVGGMYNGRGSVIRTKDGGENWERVYVEPQDGTNITAVTISPFAPRTIFIGTSGGTIARTDDQGMTWQNVHKASNVIEDIHIGTNESHVIYALAGSEGVIVSRDNGVLFENVNYMRRDTNVQNMYQGTAYSIAIDPRQVGTVVIGTNQGIYRSRDYGLSWESVDVIASTVGLPVYAVAVSPHNGQLVYAVAKAVYTGIADGWSITDTTSAYAVDVIVHDPVDSNRVFLGLRKSQ